MLVEELIPTFRVLGTASSTGTPGYAVLFPRTLRPGYQPVSRQAGVGCTAGRRHREGFDVAGRDIILIDDVLYTGRTIRAALDALFDHGRPRRVQLLVLIDRGHRELPIEASFVGRHVQTTAREIVEVKLREIDNDEKVILVERAD